MGADLGQKEAMHRLFDCTRDYFEKAKEYENYRAQEELITGIFQEHREKGDGPSVLLKVCVLDSFYSTNLQKFGVYNVAKHIAHLEKEEKIHKCICQANRENRENLKEIVDMIAEQSKDNTTKKFYSFATKYCFHHNQDAFVIYDRFVSEVLMFFNQGSKSKKNLMIDRLKKIDEILKIANTNFFGKNLNSKAFKSYDVFLDAMEQFAKYYGLEKIKPRELDHFLWVLGKDCANEENGGQILARCKA